MIERIKRQGRVHRKIRCWVRKRAGADAVRTQDRGWNGEDTITEKKMMKWTRFKRKCLEFRFGYVKLHLSMSHPAGKVRVWDKGKSLRIAGMKYVIFKVSR